MFNFLDLLLLLKLGTSIMTPSFMLNNRIKLRIAALFFHSICNAHYKGFPYSIQRATNAVVIIIKYNFFVYQKN